MGIKNKINNKSKSLQMKNLATAIFLAISAYTVAGRKLQAVDELVWGDVAPTLTSGECTDGCTECRNSWYRSDNEVHNPANENKNSENATCRTLPESYNNLVGDQEWEYGRKPQSLKKKVCANKAVKGKWMIFG